MWFVHQLLREREAGTRVAGKEMRVGGESRAARDGVSDGPVDGDAGAVSPPCPTPARGCVCVSGRGLAHKWEKNKWILNWQIDWLIDFPTHAWFSVSSAPPPEISSVPQRLM